MFKTLLLIFRKQIIQEIIIKIYNVVTTMRTFLVFVVEENSVNGVPPLMIAGVSVKKIQSLVKILSVSSSILEKASKYLLGIDLGIQASTRDPLDFESLNLLEKELTEQEEKVNVLIKENK